MRSRRILSFGTFDMERCAAPVHPPTTGRVLWYPTQAKIRLEMGTHHLLLVHLENRGRQFLDAVGQLTAWWLAS
jgi:hypothetical protein